MLNPDQKRTLASSLADIRKLSLAGQALVRGSANAVELSAMAAVCNPGKTKDIAAKDRGFLSFQATIDRAQGLLTQMDPEGLSSRDVENHAVFNDAVPRDSLIRAEPQDMVGKVAIINAYRDLSFARTILKALKDKFTMEILSNPGTRTLSDKPKKAKKASALDKLNALVLANPTLTGAEIIALMTNPVTPEVQMVQVAPMSMAAVA